MARRRPTPKRPAPAAPKPPTKQALEKSARKLADLLIARLSLHHWRIRLRFEDIEQTEESTTVPALVTILPAYFKATVVVDLRHYSSVSDLQTDLIHEFIHIVNAPLQAFIETLPPLDSATATRAREATFRTALEQTTELHTRAYWGLLRDLYS